ncbi:PepSY domain-containing protein [Oceanibacterium hippocampi]|uniref:PepSY domain-containing protein n=1 Tax=Oceanibacterium hippocampi TaxID=745714 RepID=A0A1Y5TAW4_9PROT|nr:PepSY domain-containing protein [Oceanibacterium hippocampi]SLN59797.1 hypothetical protein OCH7691_02634 [Oceanibacterium hippocampi]
MRRRLLLALICAFLALGAATPALAVSQDEARQAVRSGEVLPLSRILGPIRQNYPGKLLDADLDRRGGRWVYRIKILEPNGRVRGLTVDGRTGQIIGR